MGIFFGIANATLTERDSAPQKWTKLWNDIVLALIPFPNIDPVIFALDIGPIHLAVHWYAVAYIAGFICAIYWMNWQRRRPELWAENTPPMSKVQIEDMMTWVIIGTILGGRIGYVLFYNFSDFINDPVRIIRVWEGGMSFHGGFMGVVLGAFLFCKKNKINPWSAGDLIASSACFGLFFGRIANFINAELWGRPTDVPWAVSFPTEAAQDCGLILIDVCARHPSQLYEALLEGIVLFAIMVYLILRRGWLKKPGQMIGTFFLGYGLARLFVEGFRQADAQFISLTNPMGHIIRLGDFGLTMGQTLSLPMVAIGIALIIIARRAA